MTPGALIYRNQDGWRTILLERPTTSIGRSPNQDVVVIDPQVSRCHAVIERLGETYRVVDRGSTCGTFLNASRVQLATLKSGDVLRLGSTTGPELRFDLSQPEATAPPPDMPGQGTFVHLLSSFQELRQPTTADTATVRDMEHLNWLLRAARELNEGRAIDEILGVLLQLTLQLTRVERGFAFLCEQGEMRFALGLGTEGKILQEDFSISRRAMRQAIESQAKFSISDTLKDDVASDWASVVVNRIRSIYCIPLRARGTVGEPFRLLGLLYLDSQIRPGVLTEVDHQLLDTLAREAAALVHNAVLAEAEHNARKAREELAIAASIHSGLMSIQLPVLPYATIQARTVPCLAIGGDFYDVIELNDCVCLTIVDVSGKGVPAAIVAATLQGIIHAQLSAHQTLSQVAAMVNRFLVARGGGKYATMVLLRLFPGGRLEYLNCGHIPPVVLHCTQRRALQESSLVVGLIAAAGYASAWETLAPGERLLLTTDGVTEAENAAGEAFGDTEWDRIAHDIELAALLDRVAAFHAPEPAQDDCTLLEVRYTGYASGPRESSGRG